MDRRLYWIWLQLALRPGNPCANTILEHFTSPEEVYAADAATLHNAGIKEQDAQRLLAKSGDASLEAAKSLFKTYAALGCWMLTPDDACYPMLLRGIYAPPLVLYA